MYLRLSIDIISVFSVFLKQKDSRDERFFSKDDVRKFARDQGIPLNY